MLKKAMVCLLLVVTTWLTGCASAPPKDINNICSMFREKDGWFDDWYEAAAESRAEWGTPIPVMMAMMHQESRFKSNAKPPRTKLLGFIPWFRPSSSYGYSQAKKSTWRDYERSSGNYGADRDDFADAIDFIGWYNYQSYKKCGISRTDTYSLYLAYHEGHGGFNRRSFKNKQWLKNVATKVSAKSNTYTRQLNSCEKSLMSPWWMFWRH